MTPINDLSSTVNTRITHVSPVEHQSDAKRQSIVSGETEQDSGLAEQRFTEKSNVRYLNAVAEPKLKADSATEEPADQAPAGELDHEQIQATAHRLNEYVQRVARDLHFSVDEESGRTVMKVMERASGDLVRQVPSEEMLELSKLSEQLSSDSGPVSVILSQRV